MYRNKINVYKQTNVETADPKTLVIMCYEGMITNMKIAKAKYHSQEYEAKAKAIQKVQDILALLMQSLDFERGGEIAISLESLYNYILRRLSEGDLQKDLRSFDEIIGILEELESAWRDISYIPTNYNVETFQQTSLITENLPR